MSETTPPIDGEKFPVQQRIGYRRPPVSHRFRKGRSGNPRGRAPAAGATIREWINQFALDGLTEMRLRRIARDKATPWPKRAAAERILRTLEAPDLADFASVLNGSLSVDELRAKGVNTEPIKKVKQKTRKQTDPDGKITEFTESEIELHDRAGSDFDRVMDHTESRPAKKLDVTTAGEKFDPSKDLLAQIMSDPEAHAALGAVADRIEQSGMNEFLPMLKTTLINTPF